jgi:carbon monoxide dehydrogenase subunit G
MEVKKQITMNAPAEKIWDVVGTRFNEISEWVSFVEHSAPNPDLPEGEGRVCQTDFGPVKENITAFDAETRSLAHTIEGKSTPFFMKDILNIWQVEPLDENRSQVTFKIKARVLPPFKQLLTSRLESKFGERADEYVNELQVFVEN